MWRWLQRLFAKIRRLFARQRSIGAPVKVPVVRSDEEYFLLLGELLDRLVGERSYATLLVWSIQRGVEEEELVIWLRGVAGKISEELRNRLGWLTGLGQGCLTVLAEEIWRADSLVDNEFWKNNSDDAEAWLDRGKILFFEGRYEEAIASYDRAISFKPDYHEAWSNRGLILDHLGRYEEAIASFDRAISFKSKYHKAWCGRGLTLNNLGRYEEAIASFDRAISFKSKYHKAWCGRGLTLDNLGRYEEAIASFDLAISFRSKYHEAWYGRGLALNNLGRYEEVIESYDRAISFKPDYHEAWYNRGLALDNLGRYEGAIESFDRAISFKPDYHEAWCGRGVSLYNLGRYEKAIESFDRAISSKSKYYEAWSSRGLALDNLGRYEEAIASYDRAISFKPDYHEAWYYRGIAIYNGRGYESAIKNYQTGLRHLSPLTHPQGWANLHQATGRTHYHKGQTNSDKFRLNSQVYYNKALAAFQTAEKVITDFPEPHLELIQDFMKVHSALKDPETANSYCQQGRELLKQILNNKSSHQRRKLLTKFNSFRQLEVDILLQQQQPILALEAAELCKNLCLESLHNALQETIVSPNYHQIKTLLQPTSAIIYWHLSPSTLSTFILQPGTETPITLCNHNLSPLQNWIEQWDKTNSIAPDPTNSLKKNQTPLDPEFAKLDWSQLQQILEIDQIHQHLIPNITNLILIPHKDLHRLPLHQFFDYPITYLPSLQIALNLQQKPPTQAPPIVDLIQPPQGSDLPNAEVEITTIRALCPQGETLTNDDTTKPKFLEFIGALKDPHPNPLPRWEREQETTLSVPAPLLPPWEKRSAPVGFPDHGSRVRGGLGDERNPSSPQPQRILHFTGHSQHFARRPQESCLYLNNNQTITCPDLATSNLQPYHLIVLAACQTSIVNHQTLNDEYIGLVSACLSGGASYTISSLWSVKDIASSPFFIYFYQQLAHNIPVPQALYRTSQWLRHITNQELSEFYQTLLQKHSLTTDIQEEIQDLINRHSALAHTRPFQDPYYWAAYTVSGTAPELK